MLIDTVLMLVLLICLYTDIRYKKIYNAVTFPAAMVGILSNSYLQGFGGGLNSVKGLFLGIALLVVPYLLGGMGAGDVKLLGVVGALKGPEFVWIAFLATALVGGLISIAVMAKNKELGPRLKKVLFTALSFFGVLPRINMLERFDDDSALAFPYGIAIATGTILTYIVRWLT